MREETILFVYVSSRWGLFLDLLSLSEVRFKAAKPYIAYCGSRLADLQHFHARGQGFKLHLIRASYSICEICFAILEQSGHLEVCLTITPRQVL